MPQGGRAALVAEDEEAAKLVNEDDLKQQALDGGGAERHRLHRRDRQGREALRGPAAPTFPREGVQRDLLPLIEGCTVSTKHGMVKTDHILFIASGAFHLARPSDLIPELQGRLPIRVELVALRPRTISSASSPSPTPRSPSSTSALLATEGCRWNSPPRASRRLAETAWQVNERTENIGARRLHTVMERLLEEAPSAPPTAVPAARPAAWSWMPPMSTRNSRSCAQ